jgi:hypothetical protein
MLQVSNFSDKFFFCFFFASSSLSIFPTTIALHHKQLELHATILNDDNKGKIPSQYPVHLSLTLLTLISSVITLLFLDRSNIAPDIVSLEAGLDGQVNRLGIGQKGLRKRWGSCCLRTNFSITDPVTIVLYF